MKNKAKLFGVYLPTFAILLAAALILRTVALFLDFDYHTGYFAEKTLITVSNSITVIAVVFFFTYVFTARRDMKMIPDFTSAATYVPTGVVTVALAFLIASLIDRAIYINNFIKILSEIGTNTALSQIPSQRVLMIIILATAFFAALSIVHFVLTALIEKRSSTKRASYGIFTVVFLALYAIYVYFTTDLPINAPNKLLDQMAFLLASVFFLYETRLSLGREKWRAYIAFGFIAAFVGIYSSLPSTILYFARGVAVSNSIYESAVSLTVSGFIISRILLTGELIEDRESTTVLSLIQFANARDAVINPANEASEVIEISGETLTETATDTSDDTNQITIEDVVEAYSEESENQNSSTDEPTKAQDSPIAENEADTAEEQPEEEK